MLLSKIIAFFSVSLKKYINTRRGRKQNFGVFMLLTHKIISGL